MEGDYIDYSSGQLVRSNGEVETIELPKLTSFSGTNIITVGTTSVPDKLEISYSN